MLRRHFSYWGNSALCLIVDTMRMFPRDHVSLKHNVLLLLHQTSVSKGWYPFQTIWVCGNFCQMGFFGFCKLWNRFTGSSFHSSVFQSSIFSPSFQKGHRNGSSSRKEIRLLQPALFGSQEGWGGWGQSWIYVIWSVLTLKVIVSQIRSEAWFVTMDLKDIYFHISILRSVFAPSFNVWIFQLRLLRTS